MASLDHENHKGRVKPLFRHSFSFPLFLLHNDVKNAYFLAAFNFSLKPSEPHLLYKTSHKRFDLMWF